MIALRHRYLHLKLIFLQISRREKAIQSLELKLMKAQEEQRKVTEEVIEALLSFGKGILIAFITLM